MRIEKSKGKWFVYEESLVVDEPSVEFLLEFYPSVGLTPLDDFTARCKDWKGIEDEDGDPLEFSEQNRIAFLQSDFGRTAYYWMLIQTQSIQQFVDAQDIKKKLETISNGKSNSQKRALETA